jgi:hypothetical protein
MEWVIGFAEATGAVPAAREQAGQAGELHAADEAAQRKALRAVGDYVGASRHTASGPQGHPDCKLRRRKKRESSDPLNGRQKTPGPSLIETGFAATCEEESARLPDTNHRDADGAEGGRYERREERSFPTGAVQISPIIS